MSTARRVQAVTCPGGPLLVRGADEVIGEDGTAYDVQRPVVALCRCATSQRLPWCDGTHRHLPRDRRPD